MSQHTHTNPQGGIRRGPRATENFTVMQNRVLNDERLTFRARGVLSMLLSKPDKWEIRSDAIARTSPGEGREAIRTVMRELIAVGYLVREKYRDEHGHWITVQTIHEVPVTPAEGSTPPAPRKAKVGRPRDGKTGAFTKDSSPRTETNNNTGKPATTRVKVLGTKMLLPESATEELTKCARNLADLAQACAEAGLLASFEHVKPAQKTDILALIDTHGVPALVARAKKLHRDDNPTLYAQGWITAWKAMPLRSSTTDETPTPPSMARIRAHEGCGDCEYGWVLGPDKRTPIDPPTRCACKKPVAA